MESLVPVENGLGLYAHDYAPSALDWAGFDPQKITPTAAATSASPLSPTKKRKKKEEEEEKEKEKKKRKLGLGVSAPSILHYFKKAAPLAHTPDPIDHFVSRSVLFSCSLQEPAASNTPILTLPPLCSVTYLPICQLYIHAFHCLAKPNTIPNPLSTESLLLSLVIIGKIHSMQSTVICAEFPGVGKVQYSTELLRHRETRIWHLLA
ncbi:unnamed protein product [Fusarium fujikuroi]|nr:uncharacterized protein FFE2_11016 [Fusarium fujikuroi]VTT64368.1 unnamed protein product [Fusarium fujikuroi]